jgi:hypothetical protein
MKRKTKMKKEDIVNQETLYDYCYEKAKENVLKTWTLNDEELENLNSNEPIIFKAFIKMHDNIRLDEELENINKYYLNPEKETKKCLNKYRSCTGVFIKRIEYFITREII